MYDLTIEELNFLRWLLDKNQAKEYTHELDVDIRAVLSEHQIELLQSIQSKLVWLSSY